MMQAEKFSIGSPSKKQMKSATPRPIFFATPVELRKWLEQNHATAPELWVGYYKKNSGKPSITWPESVGEALCFGWIDGIRKSVDQVRYKIRFTPRRLGSIWSGINIQRAEELTAEGRMRPAGMKSFAARIENRSGIYSYEQRGDQLEEPYRSKLKKSKSAWNFFQVLPPGYRKRIGWWVVSAKQEETRRKRLEKLIEAFGAGKRI
jgi:uncharacterized protein YdeI (YjbR/CyaY-like superfamily)